MQSPSKPNPHPHPHPLFSGIAIFPPLKSYDFLKIICIVYSILNHKIGYKFDHKICKLAKKLFLRYNFIKIGGEKNGFKKRSSIY